MTPTPQTDQPSTACVEWTGSKNSDGYGKAYIGNRYRMAHRVAWEEAHGPIPRGLFVLHRCDNPPCVRLDHLFLGTIADNNRDAASKSRYPNQHKTHCPQGHPYDRVSQGKVWSGRRYCSVCLAEREAKRGPRHRAQKAREKREAGL